MSHYFKKGCNLWLPYSIGKKKQLSLLLDAINIIKKKRNSPKHRKYLESEEEPLIKISDKIKELKHI